MERRTLLTRLVQGMGLITGGIVGIPALITAFAPVTDRRRREVWQPVGRLEEFPVGGIRQAQVEIPRADWARSLRAQGVYIWRQSADAVVVYSRSCTDLSCPVVWDPGSEWFFCPCHGGIFDKSGQRRAGPPRRPLYRYANRVRNGILEIDLHSLPPMT